MVDKQKKRIFSGVQSPSDQKRFDFYVSKNKKVSGQHCGKSSMGQTDLLEDLVGMVGLDKDADLELGSDYPYTKELRHSKD
jgi:hypothetical protein